MKKTLNFLSIAVVALSLVSCGNDKKSNSETDVKLEAQEEKPMQMEEVDEMGEKNRASEEALKNKVDNAPLAFADNNANAVWEAYAKVQQALVASDSEKAKQEAAQLAMIFDERNAKLKTLAEGIATTDELPAQRKAFAAFSTGAKAYFKSTIKAGILYVQHCPMAFDGKGADWLAKDTAVTNPYFGAKMLNCGSVTATITQ